MHRGWIRDVSVRTSNSVKAKMEISTRPPMVSHSLKGAAGRTEVVNDERGGACQRGHGRRRSAVNEGEFVNGFRGIPATTYSDTAWCL